ncbi:hypothetical protein PIB30_045926 [Stylosanthes scabra]|uniref:Uncharacterized protein n=1 Tax=Stylosanthes scabra TaxID=79078 RepID=A0ABU6YGJ0_9FABA|nr:hypothetical protein [Stylosanthes scabra]
MGRVPQSSSPSPSNFLPPSRLILVTTPRLNISVGKHDDVSVNVADLAVTVSTLDIIKFGVPSVSSIEGEPSEGCWWKRLRAKASSMWNVEWGELYVVPVFYHGNEFARHPNGELEYVNGTVDRLGDFELCVNELSFGDLPILAECLEYVETIHLDDSSSSGDGYEAADDRGGEDSLGDSLVGGEEDLGMGKGACKKTEPSKKVHMSKGKGVSAEEMKEMGKKNTTKAAAGPGVGRGKAAAGLGAGRGKHAVGPSAGRGKAAVGPSDGPGHRPSGVGLDSDDEASGGDGPQNGRPKVSVYQPEL